MVAMEPFQPAGTPTNKNKLNDKNEFDNAAEARCNKTI